jgi:hypothetical protein
VQQLEHRGIVDLGSACGERHPDRPASLYQSGSTVTGTLESGPTTWTLEGTISGSVVTLSMKASGRIENKWSGMVTAEGTEIQQSGSATEGGNFVKGHATCTG